MVEDQLERDHEEGDLRDFFRIRYEDLLNLRRNVKDTDWRSVIKEMIQTLKEYKDKVRTSSLECLKNHRELSLSAKMSANCISVVSAAFCDKFHDLEIEINISKITDELHNNIGSLLPYLSRGIFPLRMVEIMLYVMCTICEEYKDVDLQWSSLAAQCFTHDRASQEIKLSSSFLICNLDEGRKVITKEMYAYLQEIKLNKDFFGFKEKDIKWSLSLIKDHFDPQPQIKKLVEVSSVVKQQLEYDHEESVLQEDFRKRYETLLNLRRNVKNTDWRTVINEMVQTLKEYKDKVRASSLECLKNHRELSLSAKMSANCISVISAAFCEKFGDRDIETNISEITDELHNNIASLLPYLSRGIFPLRMVEIMLYVMCTLCKKYIDVNLQWSSLAVKCFTHDRASQEIKLSSSILICHLDKDRKEVTKDMYEYLTDSTLDQVFLGFKEKDIMRSLSLIGKHFDPRFQMKELVEEPRDSGYKSNEDLVSDDEDSQSSGQTHKEVKKKKKHEDANASHEEILAPLLVSESLRPSPEREVVIIKQASSVWLLVVGALVATVAMWIFTVIKSHITQST